MNIKKFRSLAEIINKELEDQKLLQDIGQLINFLKLMMSPPKPSTNMHGKQQNNIDPHDQLQTKLEEIYEKLKNAESNNFSAIWSSYLKEIGGDKLLGNALKDRLENLTLSNIMTAKQALFELEAIQKELNNFQTAIKSTLKGLENLNIPGHEIPIGKGELSILIPRKEIKGNLTEFQNEIEEMNKYILRPIAECATNNADDFQLSTIASSDYIIDIVGSVSALALFAKFLKDITQAYINVLDARLKAEELKKAKVASKNTLDSLNKDANNYMKGKLPEFAKKIIEENCVVKDERKNELLQLINGALNRIANRIDKGFKFEVTVTPSEERKKEDLKYFKEIEAAKEMFKFQGQKQDPILKLPEPKNDQTA